MKNLLWQKLNGVEVKETIWSDILDEELFAEQKLDLKEFESLFERTEVAKTIDSDDEFATLRFNTVSGRPTINLLPEKRSNQIEIILKGLKMAHDDIYQVRACTIFLIYY